MKKYYLKNLDCASCAAKLENNLAKLDEVKFVNVNFANATMTIEADDMQKVRSRIKELEPEVELTEAKEKLVSAGEIRENRATIARAVLAALLLSAGLI